MFFTNNVESNADSLERLKKNFENGYPMVIVSAELPNQLYDEKNNNTKELREAVKERYWIYIKIESDYENNNEKLIVKEQSTLIMASNYDERVLLNFAKCLGKEFEQESIVFINTENIAYLIYVKDTPIYKESYKKYVGKINYNEIADCYSTIKGHPFVIKETVYPEKLKGWSHSMCVQCERKKTFIRTKNKK